MELNRFRIKKIIIIINANIIKLHRYTKAKDPDAVFIKGGSPKTGKGDNRQSVQTITDFSSRLLF